jgi:(5-formylfuran-3-yl)methyl phosphate synthase
MPPKTPKLLISITTPAEALAAHAAGADIIDIKDPTTGPLGMPSLQTIQQITTTLFPSDQTPDPRPQTLPHPTIFSLALGELAEIPHSPLFKLTTNSPSDTTHYPLPTTHLRPFSFAKTALANAPANWPTLFRNLFNQLPQITPVLALYAPMHPRESQALGQAHADPISTITLAAQHGARGILLDTYTKDGRSLLDSLYAPFLPAIIHHTHALGLWIALAGSLRLHHIPTLLKLNPDILGFRGAACTNHNRTASIDPEKIQQLKSALHPTPTRSPLST